MRGHVDADPIATAASDLLEKARRYAGNYLQAGFSAETDAAALELRVAACAYANTTRASGKQTLSDRIVAFVIDNPGCTSTDISRSLGKSAGARVATLAAMGRVRRRSDGGPWMYFRAKAPSSRAEAAGAR